MYKIHIFFYACRKHGHLLKTQLGYLARVRLKGIGRSKLLPTKADAKAWVNQIEHCKQVCWLSTKAHALWRRDWQIPWGCNPDYGKQVCIDIGGGLFAFYTHLSRIDVKQGDLVVAGQQIGLSGDTGNAKGMDTLSKGVHLHFEVRTKAFAGTGLGNRLNPLDYFELD
ncbi:MAG: M23 family metallopeptidase [Neisseriaceae bacterium]|nr:M23 family metallopeptidase [Neisseriaceae bacterium]